MATLETNGPTVLRWSAGGSRKIMDEMIAYYDLDLAMILNLFRVVVVNSTL